MKNNGIFDRDNIIRFLIFLLPPAVLLLYEQVRTGAIGNLTADAKLYLSIADNCLETGHFIQTVRWFKGFVVPPGLPFILLILRAVGFTEQMIFGFQALMFGGSCLLLGETEHRVLGRYGMAPLLYVLGCMRCRILLGNIMVEHYYLFLMCLLLWLVLGSKTGHELIWMNLTGLYMLMTRPALAPIYVAVLLYTISVSLRGKKYGSAAWAILLPVLCLGLNMFVNYRETGEHIFLESYSGADLYVTACPAAPATIEEGLHFYDETRDDIYYDPDLTMAEKSRLLNSLAKEYVQSHPAEYVGKTLVRFEDLFLRSYAYTTLFALIGALLLIHVQREEKKRRLHGILAGMNIFLAVLISFGIPEIRYTAVILPLAVLHFDSLVKALVEKLIKTGVNNGQSSSADSVL